MSCFRKHDNTFSACSADSANPKLLNVRGVCHFGRLQELPTLSKNKSFFGVFCGLGANPKLQMFVTFGLSENLSNCKHEGSLACFFCIWGAPNLQIVMVDHFGFRV